jgi:Spy/CpxP family protein refolding chaperone
MKASMKMVMAAAVVGASLLAIESASAMPIAPGEAGSASLVQDVGWRCGPGWHVNPWGRCVPNRRWGYGPRWGWRRW